MVDGPLWAYIVRAATTWFTGFFPLAEIYVAVPAGVALGLDDASVLLWSVLGNFTPVLLIVGAWHLLMRWPRARAFLERLVNEKARAQVQRWGIWMLLLLTPWVGVWGMAATARALGVRVPTVLWSMFVSISVYAVGTLALIRAGLLVATGGTNGSLE